MTEGHSCDSAFNHSKRLAFFCGAKRMTEFAYVGISNGTIRAFVKDDIRYADHTAKLIGEWVIMGRTVEHMPFDEAIARMRRENVNGSLKTADRGE